MLSADQELLKPNRIKVTGKLKVLTDLICEVNARFSVNHVHYIHYLGAVNNDNSSVNNHP